MFLRDIEFVDYNKSGNFRISRLARYSRVRMQKKIMEKDLELLVSEEAFTRVLDRIGKIQPFMQYVELVTEDDYFKKHREQFEKKNSFTVTEENVVFQNEKDRDKCKIPYGKEVTVYERAVKEKCRFSHRGSHLNVDLAYVIGGEIFVMEEDFSYLDVY